MTDDTHGEVVCTGCDNDDPIEDVTDLPSLFCPECGARRHVDIDPSNPDETKTDRI